jgi:hypothetical protein
MGQHRAHSHSAREQRGSKHPHQTSGCNDNWLFFAQRRDSSLIRSDFLPLALSPRAWVTLRYLADGVFIISRRVLG